jgi:hypothetical protein
MAENCVNEKIAAEIANYFSLGFIDDEKISSFMHAAGQISLGIVATGALTIGALIVREYLITIKDEYNSVKTYVKKQKKVLSELQDFHADLHNALTCRAKALLPPPPDVRIIRCNIILIL